MRRAIAVVILGLSGTSLAGGRDFIAEHAGAGANAQNAQPYIDQFLRITEQMTGWPANSAKGEWVDDQKSAEKAISERKFFPGYVLVEMEMTDDTWHLVKSTPKVTGFVGGTANKPTPISQKDVDAILRQVQEGVEKPRPKVLFEMGEAVRVKEGPFTDFHGNVEDVNYEKSKLRVSVTIFGRSTPVELDFSQVEKA